MKEKDLYLTNGREEHIDRYYVLDEQFHTILEGQLEEMQKKAKERWDKVKHLAPRKRKQALRELE